MSKQKVAFAVKRVKVITLPVFKLAKGVAYYFKFVGEMHEGKKLDDKKEAATIAEVVNLETGENGLVICPTVMRKELSEGYANHSYVGKCFEVIQTRVPGKDYNIVSLTEIAEPSPEDFYPVDEGDPEPEKAAEPPKTDTLDQQEAAESEKAPAPAANKAKKK